MNDKKDGKTKIVLFMGNVREGEYEWFYKNNIKLGIILDKNNAKKVGDLSRFELIEHFDFKNDIGDLFDIIATIEENYTIVCLLNMREFYVKPTAMVAEKYGFQGISIKAAENSLSKNRMRTLFKKNMGDSAIVHHALISNAMDLEAFINKVGLPIVVKPSNLYGSMFVDLVRDKGEAASCYFQTINKINEYHKRAPISVNEIPLQAEEFLQGSVHSIDCLVDKEGHVYTTPIVDVFTARDMGIDDFHHYARVTPSLLSGPDQEAAKKIAMDGVIALDIKSSLAHVEFVLTPSGPKLLEIGARVGGNRAHMLNKAYGIDLVPAYAKMLQGANYQQELKPKRQSAFAFLTPYSTQEGVFEQFNQLERVLRLPTYFGHRAAIQSGDRVGLAKNGHIYFLTIELLASKVNSILLDIKRIHEINDLFTIIRDKS